MEGISRRRLTRRAMLGSSVVAATAALSLRQIGASAALPVQQTGAPEATPVASPVAATPICVVRPQQTEGPYYVDEQLNRSDLRRDPSDGSVQEGVPLHLAFHVMRTDGTACTSLQGAVVDVWHCDAFGVYSDVRDQGGAFDTRGKKFLRGYQVTDAEGVARFVTVYPGWYPGRTVHIHFKIRATAADASPVFTSQLYFDDVISDQVFAQPPYVGRGPRTTRNDGDGIFRNGGNQLILPLAGDMQGYQGTFGIALQLS